MNFQGVKKMLLTDDQKSGLKLRAQRLRLLKADTNAFHEEVQTALRFILKQDLWLNCSQTNKYRLLNLRCMMNWHHLDLVELLRILLKRACFKGRPLSHGGYFSVNVGGLVSEGAMKFVESYVREEYGPFTLLRDWASTEQQRQSSRLQPSSDIIATDPEDYVDQYRARLHSFGHAFARLRKRRTTRNYRGNPWLVL